MIRERAMAHVCGAVLTVLDDGLVWEYRDRNLGRVYTCPRCGRLLTRRRMRPVVSESARGERGR